MVPAKAVVSTARVSALSLSARSLAAIAGEFVRDGVVACSLPALCVRPMRSAERALVRPLSAAGTIELAVMSRARPGSCVPATGNAWQRRLTWDKAVSLVPIARSVIVSMVCAATARAAAFAKVVPRRIRRAAALPIRKAPCATPTSRVARAWRVANACCPRDWCATPTVNAFVASASRQLRVLGLRSVALDPATTPRSGATPWVSVSKHRARTVSPATVTASVYLAIATRAAAVLRTARDHAQSARISAHAKCRLRPEALKVVRLSTAPAETRNARPFRIPAAIPARGWATARSSPIVCRATPRAIATAALPGLLRERRVAATATGAARPFPPASCAQTFLCRWRSRRSVPCEARTLAV
jgi:hypothetical protein